MSFLSPSSVIPGVVYGVWVKDSRDWGAEDAIFAIVYKGNSKFGYADFKHVCEVSNSKFCSFNKVNDGEKGTTWQHCLDDMIVFKAIVGNPIKLIDRAYTFAEVAGIAYSKGYLTDEDGLKHLSKKTAPAKSTTVTVEPKINEKAILTQAKEMSDKLDGIKSAGLSGLDGPSGPFNFQHQQTPPVGSSVVLHPGGDAVDAGEDVVVVDNTLWEAEVENWKERAMFAESRADTLTEEKLQLEEKVNLLSAQLQSSKEHQSQYMVAGDRANMTLQSMNSGTANEVVKALGPQMSALTSLDGNIENIAAKVTSIVTAVRDLPNLVAGSFKTLLSTQSSELGRNFEAVTSRVDTAHDSMSERIATTNEVLENFGMGEGECGFDIPGCLKFLMEMTKDDGATNLQNETQASGDLVSVSKACFYQSRQKHAYFVCKCGCGFEVSVDTSQLQTYAHDEQQVLPMAEDLGSNSYRSGAQAMASASAPSFAPIPSQTLHTPPAKVVQQQMLPPKVSRKEKRKLKNKNFYQAKRIAFGDGEHPGQLTGPSGHDGIAPSGQSGVVQSGTPTFLPPGQRGPNGNKQRGTVSFRGDFRNLGAASSGTLSRFQPPSGQDRPRQHGATTIYGGPPGRGGGFVPTPRVPRPTVWANPRFPRPT